MRAPEDYTVHMVGHGHIDPTWLWRWTEGYEEVRATFRSALDRMDEYPEFRFSASSACFYEWLKASEPELFERVKERVREGRWEVVGGFYVEPDCNVPSGESFVRHGLYSQSFFQKELGVRARVGFNPDSFGHAGTLPQILKKLGMDYYAYMRPSPPIERDYPWGTTFWWEAADGSKVLATNILLSYETRAEYIPERLEKLIQSPYLNPGQRCVLGFYGVGNHGGGPTKRIIEAVLEADRDEALPAAKLSSLISYFKHFLKETAADSIPSISGDLQYHARGCYAVHSEIKRMNRRLEHSLMTAERFSTAAWLLQSAEYPHAQLQHAWKDLLYNQFHDILAGTSLESSYEDARDQMGAARHCADAITNHALQSIAREVDTQAEGNTVLVFNPLSWPVERLVTVNPIVTREVDAPYALLDAEGQHIPFQRVRHERPADRRYAFIAKVPAMGYTAYHVRSSDALEALETDAVVPRHLEPVHGSATHLENAWWRIEFDPNNGGLSRLYDKEHKLEVLRQGNVLSAMVDASDTWGHETRGYRYEAGQFGGAELRLVESGPVLATVQSVTRFGRSLAIQETTIYRECPYIDVRLRVNWQEQYHTLKWGFETLIEDGESTCDIAYGYQARDARGTEEPMQQWCDLTGSIQGVPYGLALLNDSKYGYDATRASGALRITILRSPAYAHHDDARFDASEQHPIIDQGWQRASFQIVPHAGSWQDSRVVKMAWELNAPLIAHGESAHPGDRPLSASLLGTECDHVLFSVVKQSEDGTSIVARGYETSGRPASTVLHLPAFGQSFALDFAPHEIKSIVIDPTTWAHRETNLLEE